MKRTIINTVLSLILSTTGAVYSQNTIWGESGAHWTYAYVHYMAGPSVLEVALEGDTIFQSKNCQSFKSLWHKFEWQGQEEYSKYLESVPHWEYITYTSNDSVYLYHHNNFYLLYDLSASIGDSWDLNYDSNSYGLPCTKSMVQVVDTGHEMISGQNLRYIELQMMDSMASYYFDGKVYEKIGRIAFPFPIESNHCATVVDHPMHPVFKCFTDDQLPTYGLSTPYDEIFIYDCDPNFFSSINEIDSKISLKVYPNPAHDALQIRINENKYLPMEYSIQDKLGRAVLQGILHNSDCIDVSFLPAGLYFLKIQTKDSIVSDLFVKE